jgi:hypothetical protein
MALGIGSIILEPKDMFNHLSEMETSTKDVLAKLGDITQVLQGISTQTFAIGMVDLIKQAESQINEAGNATVSANNAFNSACKDVVNQLVEKFAPEGAKSDYGSPPFAEVSISTNTPDRAQIYPQQLNSAADDNQQKNGELMKLFDQMRELYQNTKNFWIGESADKTRNSFESKVVPQYEDLVKTLNQIVETIKQFTEDAVKFEASLGV